VWVALEARRRKSLAWPLGLQVAVLTGSFLTAAGRAGFGMSQAMSSRYQTISMPFWVGVVLFFVVLLASKEPRRYTSAHLGRGLLYAMPIMLAIFSGGSSVSSEAQWRRWNTNLTPAREALRTNGDGLLQTRLYPSAFVVAERRQILLRHKLLVFRKGESETPVK
jgi:hypothetical protein